MSKIDDVFRTMYNINGLSLTALMTYCIAFTTLYDMVRFGYGSSIYHLLLLIVSGASVMYFVRTFSRANQIGKRPDDLPEKTKYPSMRELIHISFEGIGAIVVFVFGIGIIEYIVSWVT